MRVSAFTTPEVGLGANSFWTTAGHKTVANRLSTVAALNRTYSVFARGLASMIDSVGPTPAIDNARSIVNGFGSRVADALQVVKSADDALRTGSVPDNVAPIDVNPDDWRRAYTVDQDALVRTLQEAERARPDAERAFNSAIEDTSRRKVAAGQAKKVYEASRENVDAAKDMTGEWRTAGIQEATGIDTAAVGSALKNAAGTLAIGGGMALLGVAALVGFFLFGRGK